MEEFKNSRRKVISERKKPPSWVRETLAKDKEIGERNVELQNLGQS